MNPLRELERKAEQLTPTVNVYVTGGPLDRHHRDTTIARLERCLEAGTISGLSVELWPRHVSLSLRSVDHSPVDPFLEFSSWAAANGYSLEPGFQIRSADSTILDQNDRILRVPMITLACYDGDELVHVAPCSCDDEVVSVPATVDLLEARSSRSRTPVRNNTG